MVYGIAIGLLGAFGSGVVGPVAVVGAGVLSALWVARGLFAKRD